MSNSKTRIDKHNDFWGDLHGRAIHRVSSFSKVNNPSLLSITHLRYSTVWDVVGFTETFTYIIYYSPQTKLPEGNVFTSACRSVILSTWPLPMMHWDMGPTPTLGTRDGIYPPTGIGHQNIYMWLAIGWYTSYWNTFLFAGFLITLFEALYLIHQRSSRINMETLWFNWTRNQDVPHWVKRL